MSLLIKNGRLVDPAAQTDKICDILIENGKIKEISPLIKTGGSLKVIDAKGLVVSPGFIDMHVHLREPGQEHKEDIATGSQAAAHGGFTSIACMPNTSPVNDNINVTRHIINRAKEIGLVNIFPVAAVSKNLESQELTDMEALVDLGVRGFSDDGHCVMSEALFKKALEKAKTLRVPIIEHPEDHAISQDGQVNEGVISKQCGLKGIPAASEDVIVERDIRLQEEVGSFLHLTHISTEGAVRLIADAKKRGVHVTADVTPHHLLLNETFIVKNGICDPNYKMKPPLRTERDRQALIEGLKTGVIDCIATDHAPHSLEEKAMDFGKAPFGVIGMETAFSVIYDRLVRTGIIDLKRLIELFSTNPARVLRLDIEGRGVVKPGLPADLTILNLEQPFKINAEDFRSKSVNCPFIGWEGKGVVEYTIVGGKVVYRRQ
ncbi:MAG: dihydroorotase [Candidatus Aminicenantes bacterium]|nr:MAG: dihydroorotase [Candidatus Aminicenantes bacterium]